MHLEKFQISWADRYTFWIHGNFSSQYPNIYIFFANIEKVFITIIGTFLVLSLFCYSKESVDKFIYLLSIIVAGYFTLMFLVLCNARYRYTAEAALLFLAAFGMEFAVNFFQNKLRFAGWNRKKYANN